MPLEYAFAAFGIAAAVILIGGAMLLRLQRDRHHFALMKTALEKGITTFPGTPPAWLISLRVGVLCLVLGIGLILAGILSHPSFITVSDGPIVLGGGSSSQPFNDAPPDSPPPPPPVHDNRHEAPPDPPPPRHPQPEFDRWRRIETRKEVSLVAISAGLILSLLGIVRIVFARLERRYSSDAPSNP